MSDRGNSPYPNHNVVAVFAEIEGARAVVDDLRASGIREDHLSLLGRPSEDAFGAGDTQPVEPPRIAQKDDESAEAVDSVASGVVAGSAAGAAGGSLLGLVAGAVATAIPGIGLAVGAGALIGAAIGAAGGSTVGGVLGGGMKLNDQFRQDVRGGRVLVGVHSDDAEVIDRAEPLLKQHHPERIERFTGG